MATKKISAMTAADTLDGTELIPLVQTGQNVKATVQSIVDIGSAAVDPAALFKERFYAWAFSVSSSAMTQLFNSGPAASNIGGTGAVAQTPAAGLLESYARNRCAASGGLDANAGYMFLTPTGNGVYRVTSGSTVGGGFEYHALFGFNTTKAVMRLYLGMQASFSQPSGDPSALLNFIGVAKDAADTNFMFMTNDGSGVATEIDSGVAPTTGVLYRLRVSCPRSGTPVTVALTNMNTGVTVSQAYSSNLPAADTELTPVLLMNTGTTTNLIQIDGISATLRWKPLTHDY